MNSRLCKRQLKSCNSGHGNPQQCQNRTGYDGRGNSLVGRSKRFQTVYTLTSLCIAAPAMFAMINLHYSFNGI